DLRRSPDHGRGTGHDEGKAGAGLDGRGRLIADRGLPAACSARLMAKAPNGAGSPRKPSMKPHLLAAAVSALLLTGAPALAQDAVAPVAYQAAIADPLRPADEVARDPLRHPAEMLAFAEVKPGHKIADIRPGAGYFTRLFARIVGEGGHVYAFVPNRTAERENPRADALVAAYPNVS